MTNGSRVFYLEEKFRGTFEERRSEEESARIRTKISTADARGAMWNRESFPILADTNRVSCARKKIVVLRFPDETLHIRPLYRPSRLTAAWLVKPSRDTSQVIPRETPCRCHARQLCMLQKYIPFLADSMRCDATRPVIVLPQCVYVNVYVNTYLYILIGQI